MKTKLLPLVCVLGLIATGCVATYQFTPYVGEQQIWKTSAGCFVETNGLIPIYYGPPNKPYTVIGMMHCNANSLFVAARDAHYHGGEAMVLVNSQTVNGGVANFGGGSTTYHSGTYYANPYGGNYYGTANTVQSPSYSVPITRTYETFAVIKFKATSESQTAATTSQTATFYDLSNGQRFPGTFNLTERTCQVTLPDGTHLSGQLAIGSNTTGRSGYAILVSTNSTTTMEVNVVSDSDGQHGTGTANTNHGQKYSLIW